MLADMLYMLRQEIADLWADLKEALSRGGW